MFTHATIARVKEAATALRIEPAALLAVAEVESAGVTTWTVNGTALPPVRFEGHYFYKLVPKSKRDEAVRAGLAHPKAGIIKNPTSYVARYALLSRAAKVDAEAAYESTSWGIGQVMGSHWPKLGFENVRELVRTANSGVDGQIDIMVRYIKAFGLVDELQIHGWRAFALQYNGPASLRNRYDEKIAAAYAKYRKIEATGADPDEGGIRTVQRDLAVLGHYRGRVDGKNGPQTIAAVKRFQTANGLVVDGIAGPMVREALDREIAARNRGQGDLAVKSGAGVTGTGAAADVVASATSSLEPVAYYSDVIQWLVIGLVLAGVALTMWGLYKNYQGRV